MHLHNTTYKHQSVLANYCRTGVLDEKIPGGISENIPHYRRLVYNVVEDILQSTYPLTFNLLNEEEWEHLVTNFFSSHLCQSPQVWYMPKELIPFVADNENALQEKYPFLLNLLQFEWVETELFMMEDKIAETLPSGTLLKSNLVLNPEHRLICLDFPVHVKQASEITVNDKGNFYVVAHREPLTGNILFTNLSPAFVRIIEYLQQSSLSITALFELFEEEFQLKISDFDKENITQFLEHAYDNKLIVGYR